MKCRAATVVRENNTNVVTGVYGERALEAIQSEAALLLLDSFPWFRKAGLKSFFDGEADYCEKELNENAATGIWLHGRRGRHRADEYERFEVVTDDAEYMLSRKLGFAGMCADDLWRRAEASIEVCDVERTGDLPEWKIAGEQKVFLGRERDIADAKIAWYAYLGRRAIRIWIAAGTLALLDMVYPSGRRRFAISKIERDFTEPLCDFASGWIERFVLRGDKAAKREQAERLRRLREEYGVELTPVSEQRKIRAVSDGQVSADAEPSAPQSRAATDKGILREDAGAGEGEKVSDTGKEAQEPKKDVPEVFQRIMEETQKGRGVGIFR